MNNYRKTMASYLSESHEMIRDLLSDANFEEAFPHVFGLPDKEHPEVAVRNEYGLLLRKAQLHIVAVQRANESNNLHSMAIHMRIVLECAAQVISMADSVCVGTEKNSSESLMLRNTIFSTQWTGAESNVLKFRGG